MSELTEHQKTELERLQAGYDGCGCADCQEFYKTIDLSVYGDRVLRFADVVCIVAGRTGATKWQQYHQNEDGNPVLKRYAPLKNEQQGVSKIKTDVGQGVNVEKNYETTKKRGRGRPRITGDEISRATFYRRKAEQGVLIA